MVYKVSVTRPAEDDAYAAFEYIRKSAPANAEKWLIGLFAAILSLDTLPARCPIISEAEELGHDVRHLLYGKRTGTYRIMFDIEEHSDEGPRVRILRIWHGARDRISVDDLAD
jgi:plasmid stabilization system protein ParE